MQQNEAEATDPNGLRRALIPTSDHESSPELFPPSIRGAGVPTSRGHPPRVLPPIIARLAARSKAAGVSIRPFRPRGVAVHLVDGVCSMGGFAQTEPVHWIA